MDHAHQEDKTVTDAVIETNLRRLTATLGSIQDFFPRFPKDVHPFSIEHKQVVEDWIANVAEAVRQASAALQSVAWRDVAYLKRLIRTCEIFYLKVQYVLWPTMDKTEAIHEIMQLRELARSALRHPFRDSQQADKDIYFFEGADPSDVAELVQLE